MVYWQSHLPSPDRTSLLGLNFLTTERRALEHVDIFRLVLQNNTPESELLLGKMQIPGAPYSSQNLWQGRDFSLCCNGFLGLCQGLPYLALCCHMALQDRPKCQLACQWRWLPGPGVGVGDPGMMTEELVGFHQAGEVEGSASLAWRGKPVREIHFLLCPQGVSKTLGLSLFKFQNKRNLARQDGPDKPYLWLASRLLSASTNHSSAEGSALAHRPENLLSTFSKITILGLRKSL